MQASQSSSLSVAASTQVHAREDALDAWVREVVAWHFDPATGSPFWLDYAKKLGWDPRERDHALRRPAAVRSRSRTSGCAAVPCSAGCPKGCAGKPVFVFETGGTTGVPKTRINCEDFRIDYEIFSTTLPDEHFPKGGELADARAVRPAPAAAGGRASARSIAAASASASTSIRAG